MIHELKMIARELKMIARELITFRKEDIPACILMLGIVVLSVSSLIAIKVVGI